MGSLRIGEGGIKPKRALRQEFQTGRKVSNREVTRRTCFIFLEVPQLMEGAGYQEGRNGSGKVPRFEDRKEGRDVGTWARKAGTTKTQIRQGKVSRAGKEGVGFGLGKNTTRESLYLPKVMELRLPAVVR